MLVARNPAEEHAALVDAETGVHLGIGVTAGVLGIGVTAAVPAAIGVEVVYLSVKDGPRRALFGKTIPASSLGNHAADALATVAGVYAGRWLVRRFAAC